MMQVLLIVFAAELLLKVISFGFVIGQGAYLKSHWNKLDFIGVIAGMIDQIAGIFLPNGNPALVRICCRFMLIVPMLLANLVAHNCSLLHACFRLILTGTISTPKIHTVYSCCLFDLVNRYPCAEQHA